MITSHHHHHPNQSLTFARADLSDEKTTAYTIWNEFESA
jgi:hypothetical protein